MTGCTICDLAVAVPAALQMAFTGTCSKCQGPVPINGDLIYTGTHPKELGYVHAFLLITPHSCSCGQPVYTLGFDCTAQPVDVTQEFLALDAGKK